MSVLSADPSEARAVAYPPFPALRGAARVATWWGRAWVRAVEEAAYDAADLPRARTLARGGRIGGIAISRGGLTTTLTGPGGVVAVGVRLPVLPDDALDALAEVVAAHAGRVEALLAGDLPHDLVEHAEEAGVELLPYGAELAATCTCTARLDPCVHALAVLHQVTWLLEADPLVLLHLRGLPREELLSRLHVLASTPRRLDPVPGDDDARLDAAVDAVLRARRVLELLDEGSDREADHLF